jgi:hypothetical protein
MGYDQYKKSSNVAWSLFSPPSLAMWLSSRWHPIQTMKLYESTTAGHKISTIATTRLVTFRSWVEKIFDENLLVSAPSPTKETSTHYL